MTASALRHYAKLASVASYRPLSGEEQAIHCLLWQENGEHKSLEVLLIDKSRLVIKKTKDFYAALRDVSPEDIDSFAVEGMIKGINSYPVVRGGGKKFNAEEGEWLNAFIVNGARWNIFDEANNHISGSTEYQSRARKRLLELARKKQKTLTVREIDAALNNISPSLKRTFRAYCRGGTVNASDLKNSMWEQHPSTDDGFYEQWMSNDHMDRFAGSPDQDPALICEKEQLRKSLDKMLKTLTGECEMVLRYRMGVGIAENGFTLERDEYFMTLEDIGRIWGIGRERVRQIQNRAEREMRHPSRADYIRDYRWSDYESTMAEAAVKELEEQAFQRFLQLNAG